TDALGPLEPAIRDWNTARCRGAGDGGGQSGQERETMSRGRWRYTCRLGFFLIPLAAAQPAASQTSNQDGAPQQTTATYEDWLLRCETKPGPPPQTVCEIVQFTQ